MKTRSLFYLALLFFSFSCFNSTEKTEQKPPVAKKDSLRKPISPEKAVADFLTGEAKKEEKEECRYWMVFEHFCERAYIHQDEKTGNFLECYWKKEDLWMKWGNANWSDSSKFHSLFNMEYVITTVYKLWANDDFVSLLRSCGSPCHQEVVFPLKKKYRQRTYLKHTFREAGREIAKQKNLMVYWDQNENQYNGYYQIIIENLKNNIKQITLFKEYDQHYRKTGVLDYEIDWIMVSGLTTSVDTILYKEGTISLFQDYGKTNQKIKTIKVKIQH